jgi:hypothetical protein
MKRTNIVLLLLSILVIFIILKSQRESFTLRNIRNAGVTPIGIFNGQPNADVWVELNPDGSFNGPLVYGNFNWTTIGSTPPTGFKLWVQSGGGVVGVAPTITPDLIIPYTSDGNITIPETLVPKVSTGLDVQLLSITIFSYVGNDTNVGISLIGVPVSFTGTQKLKLKGPILSSVDKYYDVNIQFNPLQNIPFWEELSLTSGGTKYPLTWVRNHSNDGINWDPIEYDYADVKYSLMAYPNSDGTPGYFRFAIGLKYNKPLVSEWSNTLKVTK